MMEFLRSLAPSRASDVTRAVPVLPPQFARQAPQVLQQPEGATEPLSEIDASEVGSTRVPSNAGVLAVEIPEASDGRPVVRVRTEARPADAQAKDNTNVAHRDLALRGESRAHVTRSDLVRAGDPPATEHRRQPSVDDSSRTQPASPLSSAALASRALQPRETNEVIHVSIGRIDGVANTTPPAPRREPTRRQDTVTLADYLRGNGARR
jgi:hypothetical protein